MSAACAMHCLGVALVCASGGLLVAAMLAAAARADRDAAAAGEQRWN